MHDENDPGEPVEARVRSHRWVAWVWVVPIAAAAVVVWLAWRAVARRGPEITVSFSAAQGLQPGQATIQHLDAVLGTVTSLRLTRGMQRVVVHARMTRQATPYLTDSAIFYIVTPHLGVGGISGLSTIVSGSYIEMFPGKLADKPRRHFVGLDSPPVVAPGTPGRSFTLDSPDLSSLTGGSPVTYRGIEVGVVTGYELAADGRDVKVTAFINSPNDRLVHPGSRFWNAGGVSMTLGAQGLQLRANSVEQLLAGGVAFDTSPAAMATAPSAAGSVFKLYDNHQAALGSPTAPPVLADTLQNLNDVLRNFNQALRNINRATSGPQLRDAVLSLNRVLTHLDQLTVETRPNLNDLLESLRATSAAAQRTMTLIQRRAGGTAPSSTDLPQLMSELSQAARSVRELADYLDQHPDALLRGRKPDPK